MKLMHWIFVICLWTASCDVILVFNLGGSLRLCQILMILVVLGAAAHAIEHGKVLWARGTSALLLWLLGQLLFLPAGGNFAFALQFFGLLAFTVVCILAVVQLYGESSLLPRLMKAYLGSFVFVAAFGLVQFTLPLLGLPSPLVAQYIVPHRLARINAFSYEPSYFATYMIMGWVMLVDLRRSGAELVCANIWKWITLGVTLVLFLSTSKSAWIFMIVEAVALFPVFAWPRVKAFLVRLQSGLLSLRRPRPRTLAFMILFPVFLIVGFRKLSETIDPWIFLSGTGLGNTAAHSASDRSNRALETWAAFKDNPWIGRSLGGVPVYLASRSGVTLTSFDELRNYWGFPVPLEVVVASGVFGSIPFILFVWTTTVGSLRLAKTFWPEERARWLRALARAMIYEWLILLADQNVLRVYIWFHITVVLVVAYNLKFVHPDYVALRTAGRFNRSAVNDQSDIPVILESFTHDH